jgi:hypothetical protein
MPEQVLTKTTAEILGAESPTRSVLESIFSDLHPGLIQEDRAISSIFTPQTAGQFLSQLMDLEKALGEADTYDAAAKELQARIDQAEQIRDQLLAQLFKQIRPIEQSYRELMLFFENCKVPDGKTRKPVELYVFNADPKAANDIFSTNVVAVENFVRRRNDNFNFRDDICNLVVPGFLPQQVREKYEDIAYAYGMLLIGDIEDEKSYEKLVKQFLPGGKYEFMKRPEDRAAADVVTAGYLQLRPAHWFEKGPIGDDLYGPPSLVLAGAIARTDDGQSMAQGPIGSRFGQIGGSEKCRLELLIGEMEHLSMERQLVPIIRDADNHLCFFGCRTQADDPFGVYKFFTSYRILRYLERSCRHYLLQVAGQVLTREFMEESVEKPLMRLLEGQKEQGTILDYSLFVDKDHQKRMQGICDIKLEVMPTGPAETFVLRLDVPEFKSSKEGATKNG